MPMHVLVDGCDVARQRGSHVFGIHDLSWLFSSAEAFGTASHDFCPLTFLLCGLSISAL